jgi:hypothetical protein
VQHNIDTGTSKPHKEPPRRVPYHLQDEVNDTIDKLLQKGINVPVSILCCTRFVWPKSKSFCAKIFGYLHSIFSTRCRLMFCHFLDSIFEQVFQMRWQIPVCTGHSLVNWSYNFLYRWLKMSVYLQEARWLLKAG